MNSIEAIFSLVRSMSRSEKRYFQLLSDMQKGQKSYLTLYKYLEKQEVFSDALVQGLKNQFPGNALETSRKHLYTVIMKSLRLYDAERDTEIKLMNLLHESRILYDKGMVRLSLDQLQKIKGLSIKREKFLYYILAARQELQYLVRSQFSGIGEYELLEKQTAITQMLEQENKVRKHAMLYEVLLLRYWKNGVARSQNDVTVLNDLLLEEYQILNSPGKKPFEMQKLQLHFQSIYFQMTGNPAESLKVFYQLDNLFQQHHELWKDAPIYYFHLLDGILFDLRRMDRYEEMNYFLETLRAMPSTGQAFDTMIEVRALEHRLNRCVDQNQYREARQLLHENLPTASSLSLLPVQMGFRFLFTMVRVRLAAGEYSAVLRLINAALNKPASTMTHTQYVLFELTNLQVNALLNNTDYLHYAIRSVERKLKRERKLHGVEQVLIGLLKCSISMKSFKGYEQQIEALEENPYERQLMKELCLKEWISRLQEHAPKLGSK